MQSVQFPNRPSPSCTPGVKRETSSMPMRGVRTCGTFRFVLVAWLPIMTNAKGLFMSASAANQNMDSLSRYLQAAQRACSAPWNLSTSPDHIDAVAIQSVADSNGALYAAALDRMLPALACVPHLWLGTVIPRAKDVYCGQAVFNSTFVASAVEASAAAGRALIQRYPRLKFSWSVIGWGDGWGRYM